ncbi:hypothetical protein EOD39_17923 [Acipenser ruthenus]|uniref:DUF4550 domain-containing protein n=1 Tax=Acipenser ruthenus TaxID=7906 RepID=A0A444V245_ACIRT|nr:hypothetical protein EOD39_17923 [Acipenser ruthenus]
MESSDAEKPLLSEGFNAVASPEFQSPIEYDSGVATDDGERESEREVSLSGSARGAGGSPAPPQSESTSQIHAQVTESSMQIMNEPSGPCHVVTCTVSFAIAIPKGGVKQLIMKHRKLFRKSQPKPSFTGNKDNSLRDDRKVSELSFETGEVGIASSLTGMQTALSVASDADDSSPQSFLGEQEAAVLDTRTAKLKAIPKQTVSTTSTAAQKKALIDPSPNSIKKNSKTVLISGRVPVNEKVPSSGRNKYVRRGAQAALSMTGLMKKNAVHQYTWTQFICLQVKCAPVYCRYQFYNLTDHRTASREHGTHVYLKDVNVIFTGLLGKGEFREYVRGTPIEIEIHDRDRKMEETMKKSALFGTEPEDAKISNVGLVSSQRTTHNPFTDKDKLYNPYGVAKLDLSDLLYGEKRLKVTLPIHASPLPDPTGIRGIGGSGRIVGYPGSVDGPQDPALPAGHYLDSSSQLKVTVEIVCPLPLESEVIKGQTSDCPFGRIICIFDSLNSSALKKLNSEICRINSAALQLDSYPEHLLEAAFNSYKLKPQQRESTELDIVTGFHVQDDEIHLFVLEGLKDKAIQRLWENIPRCDSTGERMLKVLYNSDLCFHQRLYASLDLNLCRVHLHKPLSDIMKQPLLYVRDMVPQACFQALSRLDLICKLKKLKDVTHYNLFPSSEMILSMSQEFGIPLRKASLDTMNDLKLTSNQSAVEPSSPDFKSTTQLNPLDNYNEKYDNIHCVHQASRKLQGTKPDTFVAVLALGKEVHNYSCQTMNSTEQAKELLRREMAKEPSRRFTYCQEYQSATVSPVDLEDELKEAAARSKAAWRTWNGFTYPGFKSSIESNEHEKRPSEARAEELEKPWEENILHANTCAPTLLRDRWEWSKRHVDVELYKKPPLFFGTRHPITIHLAGVPESELHTNGAKLDRLQGLLKDKPRKHSLRNPGMVLKPWEENILHANTCAPTLLRDRWEWSKRHVDVELYKKPPLFFGTRHPITIHLAASRKLRRTKPDTVVAVPAPGKEVHNYSCQTMNSTEQAKELLRREMAKEPSRRFTYCQEYQSATVSPVDLEDELKEAAARSKAAWRTWNGFTYPGFKSSIESNEHERRPSEARAEELIFHDSRAGYANGSGIYIRFHKRLCKTGMLIYGNS